MQLKVVGSKHAPALVDDLAHAAFHPRRTPLLVSPPPHDPDGRNEDAGSGLPRRADVHGRDAPLLPATAGLLDPADDPLHVRNAPHVLSWLRADALESVTPPPAPFSPVPTPQALLWY